MRRMMGHLSVALNHLTDEVKKKCTYSSLVDFIGAFSMIDRNVCGSPSMRKEFPCVATGGDEEDWGWGVFGSFFLWNGREKGKYKNKSIFKFF